MKRLLLFILLSLAAITMQAQKRCAVLDLRVGDNVTTEETDAISYVFRSNFQPSNYEKIKQPEVTRAIRDFGYSRTNMTWQQMVRIGRELEANIIVVGTLNKLMDEYSVDFIVIDVAKGTPSTYENVNFQKSDYRNAMEKTAKKLASKLRGGTASSSVSTSASTGYTDLGLPSGTIWKDFNATGFYTYDEAVSQFGSRLPTKAQWEELKAECQWSWTGSGYKVTGPNGNSIVLPASGCHPCKCEAPHGHYLSSSLCRRGASFGLMFDDHSVSTVRNKGISTGYSVRLVKYREETRAQIASDYTDLGLPSGTKWKNFNAIGLYTYYEAVSKFGGRLPTIHQWEELKVECQWLWTDSCYKVTGPNGNSIVLPASGFRNHDGYFYDTISGYWSYTHFGRGRAPFSWALKFNSGRVDVFWDLSFLSFCVRLVQDKEETRSYTDLGLPSGTKWKNSNAPGFYSYKEAVSRFGNRLPTKAQWEELKAKCQWSWTGNGYKVIGPNGNSIVLPASGYRDCDISVSSVGSDGNYWSSTPDGSDDAWYFFFFSGGVYVRSYDQCYGLSVRLVQD